MKRFLCMLTALLLLTTLSVGASAQTQLVWDYADLLTDPEQTALQARLSSMDGHVAAVLTVDSLEGKSAQAYAEAFWDEYYYGSSGVLLLVSMSERQWWISTNGSYAGIMDDAAMDRAEEDFVPYLSQGDYAGAFAAFAEACRAAATQPGQGNGGASWKTFLICLVIGLVLALIAVCVMAAQLKSVRPKNSAGNYIRSGSMQVTHSRDIFLYQNTTRRAKPQNNGSHGGGGGHSRGGRGGSF